MSDLWLLLPTAAFAALATLAIRWKCYALSIVFSVVGAAALVILAEVLR